MAPSWWDSSKIWWWLLGFWFLVLPSNLFFKLVENSAYVNGLLVDYLIPKVFVSDLIVVGLLLLKPPKLLDNKVFVITALILLVRQFFTLNPIASFHTTTHLLLVFLFALSLSKVEINSKKLFIHNMIGLSLIAQILVASYQFIFQKSLLPYGLLGESNLQQGFGLATGIWQGGASLREVILPYGTTAHPNILAGWLVIMLLGFWLTRNREGFKWFEALVLIAGLLVLFLTQSISAWLSLLLTLLFLTANHFSFLRKKTSLILGSILVALLLTPYIIHQLAINYPLNQSLTRRDLLNQAAGEMFKNNPVLGVGLNNFTVHLESYSPTKEVVRFLQPVHHIPLLVASEIGIFGLGLTFWLLKKNLHSKKILLGLILLSPLMALDHYLLTNQTGLLLLVTMYFFSYFLDPD